MKKPAISAEQFKRIITLCVVLFATTVILNSCCNPEIIGSVPNTLRPQETGNWCWAAVTQMLADHCNINVNQCDLANERFGRTDCCNENNPGTPCPKLNACNKPGWLMLDFVGIAADESTSNLAWADIRNQIYCRRNPMGYAYGTPGVVGHVVIIKGYVSVGETNYIVLNDPWAPCVGSERLISFEEYADPAGTATHWRTWYNINCN